MMDQHCKPNILLSGYPTSVYLVLVCLVLSGFSCQLVASTLPTRSTTIALTNTGRTLVSVNKAANSVTVFSVSKHRSGKRALNKIAEIPVGKKPYCVAIQGNRTAYITNSASGTVSVIRLRGRFKNRVVRDIPVGKEPRGCALTPRGNYLFVANHTDASVSIINTKSLKVSEVVPLAGNPTAIAVSNYRGRRDEKQTVFVSDFYAKLIPDGSGEGFDDGKQGIVYAFPVGNPSDVSRIPLSPIEDSGFTADRSAFCPNTNPALHSDIYCPDNDAQAGDAVITQDPQGAFPNQLQTLLIRGDQLMAPNIGAAPEPPVGFNVNVQGLVHYIDIKNLTEQTELHQNINNQIKTEQQPAQPDQSLDRLFINDLVAMDCNRKGDDCLLVSRGGNYVLRASRHPDGNLNIHAPDHVVRFQTGNIPNGVVIDRKGKRAYVNNEVSYSVSVLDLNSNQVIAQNIPSSRLPDPGSFAHRALIGKLVFFTALGTPDNELAAVDIRNIDLLPFRGKASDNAWSSCASCHPAGLADGVTWLFPTGPRQTIPLDGFYGKDSPAHDQRISNWNAVRGSITDFNNNSRNIQGGEGFAGNPPNPNIFNHGITQGASQALDYETLWVQTVRTPNMPETDLASQSAGASIFDAQCASCHGGSKWTKSQIFHIDNPAFNANPLAGGSPIDPGITNAGPQIISYTKEGSTLTFLESIDTFLASDEREIRGAGGAIGQTALGGLGFNVPSLLGVGYHAPYFHNGSAQTLEDVFKLHGLNGSTIANSLSKTELNNLLSFLISIDTQTSTVRSEGDDFRDLF